MDECIADRADAILNPGDLYSPVVATFAPVVVACRSFYATQSNTPKGPEPIRLRFHSYHRALVRVRVRVDTIHAAVVTGRRSRHKLREGARDYRKPTIYCLWRYQRNITSP